MPFFDRLPSYFFSRFMPRLHKVLAGCRSWFLRNCRFHQAVAALGFHVALRRDFRFVQMVDVVDGVSTRWHGLDNWLSYRRRLVLHFAGSELRRNYAWFFALAKLGFWRLICFVCRYLPRTKNSAWLGRHVCIVFVLHFGLFHSSALAGRPRACAS